MKSSRIVSLFLALVMLMTFVPSLSLAEEPVKLTGLFYKNSLTASFDTLEWLNQAEAAANVDITWQEVISDFDAVKGAMFAAGKAPDIMIRSVSESDLITFYGLFADIAPYINEENTPNIMAMFKDFPEIPAQITNADGEIYGLPSFEEFDPATSNVVSGPFWINKQWLDNLGLEAPTTWDEFKTVLKAFKENDANGNGDPDDEIPFDALQWVCNWSFLQMLSSTGMQLMAAGTSDNLQNLFFAEDGVIKSVFTDLRFKEFILFMRDLHNEGLIHADFFTKDYDTYVSVSRGSGKTAKVGVFATWDPPSHAGDEIADQYICMPILSSKEGVKGTGVFCVYGNNIIKNMVVLSKKCADKVAALRFIDQFYDTATNHSGFGIQSYLGGMNDVDKRLYLNEDGFAVRIQPNDGVTDMNTYCWQNGWVVYGPYYFKTLADDDVAWLEEGQTVEEAKKPIWRTQSVNEAGYADAYVATDIKDIYWEPALTFSEEDRERMSLLQADWGRAATSPIGAWITGTQDIEAEWDSYVETLKSYGIDECTAIRQRAYDAWIASMK